MLFCPSTKLLAAAIVVSWTSAATAVVPLDAVPESALLVARLERPRRTHEVVRALIKNAAPDLANQVPPLPAPIEAALQSPLLNRGDGPADWWFVLMPPQPEQPMPGWLLFVPTKNAEYQAVLASAVPIPGLLEQTPHAGWTIFGDPDTVRLAADVIASRVRPVESRLSGDALDWIQDHQAAAWLVVESARSIPGYDQAHAAALQSIPQMFTPPLMDGIDLRTVVRELPALAREALQLADDCTGIGLGLTVSPEGATLSLRVETRRESTSHAWIAALPTSEFPLLRALPRNDLLYLALAGDGSALLRWTARLSADIYGVDPVGTTGLVDALDSYARLGVRCRVSSLELQLPSEGVVQWTTLVEVDDPDALRANRREFAERASRFDASGVDQSVHVASAAEVFPPGLADILTTNYAFTRDADPFGLLENVTYWMYGPAGMTTRLLSLPGAMLETTGGGRIAMERAIDARTNADELAAAVWGETAGRLGQPATLMLLIDGPRLFARATLLLAGTAQFPLPIDVPDLEPLSADSSYAGLALVPLGNTIDVRLHVPAAQARSVLKLVEVFSRQSQQERHRPSAESPGLRDESNPP